MSSDHVPRFVRRSTTAKSGATTLEGPEPLDVFRDSKSWILLGEPGAGKTTAFEMEAQATGGLVLSIREFIKRDAQPDWSSKTLYLDGLDEVRAIGDDSILMQVRNRLSALGNPPFRLSCRAADWLGETDSKDLWSTSGGSLPILYLEPLSLDDIHLILKHSHHIEDPKAFTDEAEHRGVTGLLDNPQNLGLLAKAIRGQAWPETRFDTFELACEYLAKEANDAIRKRTAAKACSVEQRLHAGGHLCAILLLADQVGVALDEGSADDRYFTVGACLGLDPVSARESLQTRLFRGTGEERVIPNHRNIAEFLAARWLNQQITSKGLPVGRLLNVLVGKDGRTPSSLRGLYAWLAGHCLPARKALIAADPLTVIIYGDAKPMSLADKRFALEGLKQESERYPGFRMDARRTHRFGALADQRLLQDFSDILHSKDRSEAYQSFVDCVADILIEGELVDGIKDTIRDVIDDDSWWPDIRKACLRAWLRYETDSSTQLALLNGIAEGCISDTDDDLLGALLLHLYPDHLTPDALLSHLHPPKQPHLSGMYSFLIFDLARLAPLEHLPVLLDGLAAREECIRDDLDRLDRSADRLLERGVQEWGDSVSGDRLFDWLDIGADEYGYRTHRKGEHNAISSWLESHPDRYKNLLGICYARAKTEQNPEYRFHVLTTRFRGAKPPVDLACWHLEQVHDVCSDWPAQSHEATSPSNDPSFQSPKSRCVAQPK